MVATDVDTDASGDLTVTFANLRRIDERSVEITLEAGYEGHVQSVSGNQATVRIYYYDYDAVADGAAIADTSDTDISILHGRASGD